MTEKQSRSWLHESKEINLGQTHNEWGQIFAPVGFYDLTAIQTAGAPFTNMV